MAFFINWDSEGEKFYETGIDRGVLYIYDTDKQCYQNGVNWNGLTSINETSSGAEPTDFWADNIKYVTIRSPEHFNFTINAYTSPVQFDRCDGVITPINGVKVTQQERKTFGLSYRTLIGNDIEHNDYAYEIHLVYGATCSPSDKDRTTVNDSPDAVEFSWDCVTNPIRYSDKKKPTAHLIIRSSDFITEEEKTFLKEFEEIIYGKYDDEGEYIPITPDAEYYPDRYYTKLSLWGMSYYKLISTDTPPQNWGDPTVYFSRGGTEPRLPLPREVIDFFRRKYAGYFMTRDGIAFYTKDEIPYCVMKKEE